VKRSVVPLQLIAPATGEEPGPVSVKALAVAAWFIASLKVAVTGAVDATPVAPSVGVTTVTAGAVVSPGGGGGGEGGGGGGGGGGGASPVPAEMSTKYSPEPR